MIPKPQKKSKAAKEAASPIKLIPVYDCDAETRVTWGALAATGYIESPYIPTGPYSPGIPKPKKRSKKAYKQAKFEKQFHSSEFVEWTKGLPCATCGRETMDIECSHVKSRGAGGTWGHIIPQCMKCHRELHAGIESFCTKRGYGVDHLLRLAVGHAAKWLELTGPASEDP